MGDFHTEFTFTSININRNYGARLHRDGGNVGPSFIKAFGEFTGGALNYFPEDDRSTDLPTLVAEAGNKKVKVNLSKGLLLFDGKRAHEVDPFEGERYTLVFFTAPRYWKITDEARQTMQTAGLPMPTEKAMQCLKAALRPPQGYAIKGAKAAAAKLAAAKAAAKAKAKASKAGGKPEEMQPYRYWSHEVPERVEAEKRAAAYWKKRGLREVMEDAACPTRGVDWEHTRHLRGQAWTANHVFVLANEPARKDLVLREFRNCVDACAFLNDPKSAVPKAITRAGYCTVLSNRTRTWYVIYKKEAKEAAMQAFGMAAEQPRSKRVARGEKAAKEAAVLGAGG
eukprot:NODE_1458_length_1137_cov_337.290203.p1 GENE.NODE_1458_length_1137_cov_337.290203~~NODE_1458_length_1137_cov_337.290203.p1  ORF type:complete len:340 (-),score=95.62 NODE_1458_length_1137_cov_337.290203:100-1119(-)